MCRHASTSPLASLGTSSESLAIVLLEKNPASLSLEPKMALLRNRQLMSLNRRRSERDFIFVPVEMWSRSLPFLCQNKCHVWRACFHMLSQGLNARSAALACHGEIRPYLMTLMLMRQQTLSAGLHRQARRGLDLCFFPSFFILSASFLSFVSCLSP